MNISHSIDQSRTPSNSTHDLSIRRISLRRISEKEEIIAYDRIFQMNSISRLHPITRASASRPISRYCSSTRISSTPKAISSENYHLNFRDTADVRSILKAAYEELDYEKEESVSFGDGSEE